MNDQTDKWYLSLATSDYGGGSDEGQIFDSLDEVLADGPSYIHDEFAGWRESELDCCDDEEETEQTKADFEIAMSSSFKTIIGQLVKNAKKKPDSEHTYSFGSIGCADDCWIVLRKATQFDIDCFG